MGHLLRPPDMNLLVTDLFQLINCLVPNLSFFLLLLPFGYCDLRIKSQTLSRKKWAKTNLLPNEITIFLYRSVQDFAIDHGLGG